MSTRTSISNTSSNDPASTQALRSFPLSCTSDQFGAGNFIQPYDLAPVPELPEESVSEPAAAPQEAIGTVQQEPVAQEGDSIPPSINFDFGEYDGIQVTPRRRHPRSGFPYPEMLRRYGVNAQQWQSFLYPFITANMPDTAQYQGGGSVTRHIHFGPLGVIFHAVGGLMRLPLILAHPATSYPKRYFYARRNLKQIYNTGSFADWLIAWNENFFNPKGLHADFQLSGLRFEGLDPVDRKGVQHSATLPRKTRRAARRARVLVAIVAPPNPRAGQRPPIVFNRTPGRTWR